MVKAMLKALYRWLFEIPDKQHSFPDIISWWERRRFAYNLIIGCVGVINLFVLYNLCTYSSALKSSDVFPEPLALIAAPIAINICYTVGWFVEGILAVLLRPVMGEKVRLLGPRLLKIGMIFSLAVITYPVIYSAIITLVELIRSIF